MIRTRLDSVEEIFTNELLGKGVEIVEMNVRYIFAKDEYIGSNGDYGLMTKKEAIRVLTQKQLEYIKGQDYSSFTDEEYEKHFKASVETNFSIVSEEILLPIANKQHYILKL